MNRASQIHGPVGRCVHDADRPTASAGRRHRPRGSTSACGGRRRSDAVQAAQGHTSGSAGPTFAPSRRRTRRARPTRPSRCAGSALADASPVRDHHAHRPAPADAVGPRRACGSAADGRTEAIGSRRRPSGSATLYQLLRRAGPGARCPETAADPLGPRNGRFPTVCPGDSNRRALGVRPARTSPEVSGRGARASPSQVSNLVDQMPTCRSSLMLSRRTSAILKASVGSSSALARDPP